MKSDLLSTIRESWGWVGLDPEQVVGENDFGNLIIRDERGRCWRLCPEDLYCRVIAEDRAKLEELSNDQAFLKDWYVKSWVEDARATLGALRLGYKYYFVTPGVLGGRYTPDNMQQLSLTELISISGDIARQIDGLPDGATVRIGTVP
jgi:hypothetical protein